MNSSSRTTAATSKRAPRRALAGLLAVVALGAPATLNGVAAASAATPATSDASTAAAPTGASKKVIGMSAPSKLWNERLAAVGSCGVESRRIFADLASNGRGRSKLIEQAVKAGMMPVISYKVPSVRTLNAGGYDSWLKATRDYLTGLGVQVTATFWHEPHGDMSAAEFRSGSQRFLDKVKAPNVAVGPILNGWLLDNQVSTFASYTSPGLLAAWDFVAVDSYQNGTQSAPGELLPARAVPLLAEWLDQQGFPDKRIGLGEYNGFTGEAMRAAGEAILSTPEAWFGLAWNSSTSKHAPLTGDRLKGFQATKADPRALKDAGC